MSKANTHNIQCLHKVLKVHCSHLMMLSVSSHHQCCCVMLYGQGNLDIQLVASSLFIFPPTNMAYALNQEEGLKVIAHNITHGSSESGSPKIHIKMPFICLKYLEQSIRYQWIQRKLKKQLSQFHKLAF